MQYARIKLISSVSEVEDAAEEIQINTEERKESMGRGKSSSIALHPGREKPSTNTVATVNVTQTEP